MKSHYPLPMALYFSVSLICLITSFILIFYSSRERKSNLFLGASFLTLSFLHFIQFLIQIRQIVHVPYAYRTGNILALLYMPLTFLYVRLTITKKKIAFLDCIHLLPVLIYIVDMMFQINEQTQFKQGWLLTENFRTSFLIILIAVYWFFQVGLVVKRYFPVPKVKNPDTSKAKWFLLFFGFQMLLLLPAIVILPFRGNADFLGFLNVPSSLGALLMTIAVLFHPKLAYGIDPGLSQTQPLKQKAYLSDEFVIQATRELDQLFYEQKPFLRPGYSIKHMASDLRIPPHQLSAFINQSLGKNFNDLINAYRIKYCKELFRAGQADNLNMYGLAMKCGFSNRNTFTTAFKRYTGVTPSIYIRLSQNQQDSNNFS